MKISLDVCPELLKKLIEEVLNELYLEILVTLELFIDSFFFKSICVNVVLFFIQFILNKINFINLKNK